MFVYIYFISRKGRIALYCIYTYANQAFSQRGVWVSLDNLLLSLDTLICVYIYIMQWNEKELDTQFTPNVYFWTPNSEILAKALILAQQMDINIQSWDVSIYTEMCTYYRLRFQLSLHKCQFSCRHDIHLQNRTLQILIMWAGMLHDASFMNTFDCGRIGHVQLSIKILFKYTCK